MTLRKDTIKLWLFLAALLAVWMAKDSAVPSLAPDAGVERSSLRSPGNLTSPVATPGHTSPGLYGPNYARRFGVGQLFGGLDG